MTSEKLDAICSAQIKAHRYDQRNSESVVILRPVNLRWILGAADAPKDLCAHGDVEFRIGDDELVDAERGKGLTVSAAALYLLRTLTLPHTKDAPVGDHLFPCCGFAMFDEQGCEDVYVCGCPNGVDFEVLHAAGGADVLIHALDDREWKISWPEWRTAVYRFADHVSSFYAASLPKQPENEEDERGFRKFMSEWDRRRGQEFAGSIVPDLRANPALGRAIKENDTSRNAIGN